MAYDYVVGENYFNLEGDAELYLSGSEDFESAISISWRDDPTITMSDWKIIVATKNDKSQTYHVHKSILSSGPRSSKYFAKLFALSKGTPSKHLKYNLLSNNDCTRIELSERDANNMPIILDFIYAGANTTSLSCNGTVATAASSTVLSSPSFPSQVNSSLDEDETVCLGDDINTQNAVSIRHLSRLFGCDALTFAINKFIQRDLSFKTGPTYFKQAYEYKDDRLLEASKRLCCEHFASISVNPILKLSFILFKDLIVSVGCDKQITDNTSLVLSEVVYLYLESHPAHFTAENLLDLTDSHIMPKIGPEPAVGFTALVRDLDSKSTIIHWRRLVDLCQRCAQAVVAEYGWTDFSVQAAVDEFLDGCSKDRRYRIDSLLFATSFASALQQAQADHIRTLQSREEVDNAVQNLQQSVKLLEKNSKRKDDQIEAQKRNAEEAKRQIMYLKKKLAEARQNHGERNGGLEK